MKWNRKFQISKKAFFKFKRDQQIFYFFKMQMSEIFSSSIVKFCQHQLDFQDTCSL